MEHTKLSCVQLLFLLTFSIPPSIQVRFLSTWLQIGLSVSDLHHQVDGWDFRELPLLDTD